MNTPWLGFGSSTGKISSTALPPGSVRGSRRCVELVTSASGAAVRGGWKFTTGHR